MLLLLLTVNTVHADTAAGLQWLSLQNQTDGSISLPSDISTSYQSTSEVLKTFIAVGNTASPIIPAATQYIDSDTFQSSEYLSRRIIVDSLQGKDVTTLVTQLKTYQNRNGGFGELAGYDSTPADTAFALEALASIGETTTTTVSMAVTYLINTQTSNGGWHDGNNQTSVYTTALVLNALTPYRTVIIGVSNTVINAESYLITQRAGDLWDTDFDSALALIALTKSLSDSSVLSSSITALQAKQITDGSWQEDTYITALAVRALAQYAAQSSKVSSVDATAGIAGTVIDALSGNPLSGVTVMLLNEPGSTTTTNGSGIFSITGISAGSHTLVVEMTGYNSVSHVINLNAGEILNYSAISLYPTGTTSGGAPTTLTLYGTVNSGLTGQGISGATVHVVETGDEVVSDSQGNFVLSGLTLSSFQLTMSATGYDTHTYDIAVDAFGEVAESFPLSPTNTVDPSVTTTTLSGTITDHDTGVAIANASIAIPGTALLAVSDTSGHYTLDNIDALTFDYSVTALGYQSGGGHITLSSAGVYTLDLQLSAITLNSTTTNGFQVLSVNSNEPLVKSNTTATITASVGNLADTTQSAVITGEVVDSNGTHIADLVPFAPNASYSQSEFSFASKQIITVTLPWSVAHNPPGTYDIIVRAVTPGTFSRDNPKGNVLSQATGTITVAETYAIDGVVSNDPPLVQSGTGTPVHLSALVINDGNVDLVDEPFTLTITDPATATVLHSVTATASTITAGQHNMVAFGDWIPTTAGNLAISIVPVNTLITGAITGKLYVGNKATANFTVDKNVVAQGTQTVHATVSVTGVDNKTATNSDPLYYAVRDAVARGGDYAGSAAINWQKLHRCLGCHMQSQALVGLSDSLDKAPVDEFTAKSLLNAFNTSVQEDGGLRNSEPMYSTTQTGLGGWALTAWPKKEESYRSLFAGAKHLYDRRLVLDPYQIASAPDEHSGWWGDLYDQTYLMARVFAEVVKSSALDDVKQLSDYQMNSVGSIGTISAYDMEEGKDGNLYIATTARSILSYNPATNTFSTYVSGLPFTTLGLAIADNGDLYVTNSASLYKVNADGSYSLIASGLGHIRDIEFGPDGNIYGIDNSNSVLRRIHLDGTSEVLLNNSILRNPYGLAVGTDGNIYIADTNNYDIVKYDVTTGVGSVFADALTYKPARIQSDKKGGFYYSSLPANRFYSENYEKSSLNYLSADGVAQRLKMYSFNELLVALSGGRVFAFPQSLHTLLEMIPVPFDSSEVDKFRQSLPKIANFYLQRYNDYSNNNLTQSMILMGLYEARTGVTNTTTLAYIDGASKVVANRLWSHQHSNGSWGKYSTSGGDPAITAIVGMALDYTNPSAGDPRVRNSIEYLLSTQAANNTWSSMLFSTRVASTGLVMAYLPKALARIGGIDVGFNLTMPPNIQLLNETLTPTSATPTTEGGMNYLWSLKAVTDTQQDIGFDLTLQDMQLHETRPAASAANIVFNNSFTNEPVTVGVDIPSVTAVSDLHLNASLDKTSYQANEPVQISGVVNNVAAVDASGTVQWSIRAAGATTDLYTLAPESLSVIPANGQVNITAQWNTATQLVGHYEVVGQLLDSNGKVANEVTLPFDIVFAGNVVNSSVTTDKPEYQAWDSVAINTRVQNASSNTIQPPTFTELTVKDPLNNTVMYTTATNMEMQPNAIRDLPQNLLLHDAIGGPYSVTFVVKDEASREVISTSSTSFKVNRTAVQSLIGSVTANPRTLYVGKTIHCDENVINRSASDVSNVTLTQQLIDMTDGIIVDETTLQVDVAGNQTLPETYDFDTKGQTPGVYACRLSATVNGEASLLGAAGINLTVPPIVIDSTLQQGQRGRLLVMLDGVNGVDPHGVKDAPTLDLQRDTLVHLLDTHSWTYTIVTDANSFAKELRSGNYTSYAVLSEQVKLDEQVQKEVREAVYRGAGLLIAGTHDDRNHNLYDAEGIKLIGELPASDGVDIQSTALQTSGSALTFLIGEKGMRIDVPQASAAGYFTTASVVGTDVAATTYHYGQGNAVFVGFDLLAEATAEQGSSLYSDVLENALTLIQPASVTPIAGGIVPVQLHLQNKGIAVTGQVIIPAPAGATWFDAGTASLDTNGAVQWPFDLAVDASEDATFWLRLPTDASVTTTLTADIQTGTAPDFVEYGTVQMSITPVPQAALDNVVNDLSTYLASNSKVDSGYKRAFNHLQKAQSDRAGGDIAGALTELVSATDDLLGIGEDYAAQLRLKTDQVIGIISRNL